MKFIPVFIDFTEQKLLFIGGGKTAEQKLKLFENSGAVIHLIAPEITPVIANKVTTKAITHIKRLASTKDINRDYFMVYAVTNDCELNKKIAEKCKELHIPCNRCDSSELRSLVNGAIIEKENIKISITAEGVPTVTQALKKRIEPLISDEIIEATKIIKEIREKIKSNKETKLKISEITNKILADTNLQRIKNGEGKVLKQEILTCL